MSDRYTDNDDGTLTDRATGLMWQESYAYAETGNYVDWYEAQEYIARLNANQLGGHADWRLPDKLELQSLYEISYSFESRGRTYVLHIDPIFEFGYGSCFWTWRSRLSGALGFMYDVGEMNWFPKGSVSATIRAVRSNMNPFKLLLPYEKNTQK
ncbi:MAG: DUF1566 domain-containing protein [Nitrospina sp.]|nr:MAG: DUF1566 domain-containing protein [Nitrospina sp.]